jgi:small-conductance mechanosensitive channel
MGSAATSLGSCVIAVGLLGAANPPAQAPSASTIKAPMSAEQVIQLLDQTGDWYRTLGIQQQAANEPSDLWILYENRETAVQVIGLAFDVARADVVLLDQEPAATSEGEDATVAAPALTQLQKKLEAQRLSVQSELDSAQHQLTAAPNKTRPTLQAKIAELHGELDLIDTKKGILDGMSGVANSGAAATSSNLRAQIDAMAVALPAASAASQPPAGATSPATARAATTASSPLPASTSAVSVATSRYGLWNLADNVLRLSEKIGTVDMIDLRTAALQATLTQIRARLIDQMRALSARGDALVAQADTADSAALNGVHDQFDALTNQFKQASAILIPLSKEDVLLQQYRRSLRHWRDAVENESRDAWRSLGVRVGVLLAVLGVVFAFAELWRRMVLRYVQDSRRRYQLMLLRRIALWSLVVIIVGFAFASELGSIVTFAGLITAGLAVAMQSVLVSIVGYFFLIGKYGVRVGDRVQIGDVYGEVIDIGLVRMHLMEIGGHGTLGPTGRVVAFANSVVFQVSTGLFKQIPGVDFTWHEMTLSIPTGADYASTKEKLIAAVIDALKDYHGEIRRQTREIQKTTLSNSGGDALPTVQLHFSADGVVARVRYPVHLQHAAEIDERVSQALLYVISGLTPAAADEPH